MPIPSENSAAPALEFAAYIGLDWGDAQHAVALSCAPGAVEDQTLCHSAEALHSWLRQLATRFQSRPVALAVESARGPLIHVFSDYPWLTVYPVHPTTSARFRTAFTPSGAKDDQPDARLLLELLCQHRDKLRPLQPEDAATRQLAAWAELRRDMVDRRTQLLNQLTSLLKSYYPQALVLAGQNLGSPLALDFLARWPDLLALKASHPATLKKFYHRHQVRRPELVQKRLDFLQQAVALTTDDAVVIPARFQLRLLLDQLRTIQKHIALATEQIAAAFAAHPEAELFRDLPGAGPALGPRLLVAFGTDRARYPDPPSLQKYAGLAPVREKSGRQLWTHWRWFAPRFLRQTFVEWAGQTVVWSAWAGEYYRQQRAKGKGHQTILRALAFKWIRVLWKCWQKHEPYNEARYLKQLLARKSPHAVSTPA